MQRGPAALLVAVLLVMAPACTDTGPGLVDPTDAPSASASAESGGLAVGIVEPVAGIYPEAAGLSAAIEAVEADPSLDIASLRRLTPDDGAFRADLLQLLAAQGADLVCAFGSRAAEDLVRSARAFPATPFCLIDAAVSQPPGNVRTLTFDDAQAAYIAGVAAAAQRTPERPQVGFITGTLTPTAEVLRVAFELGARSADAGIEVIVGTTALGEGEQASEAAGRVVAQHTEAGAAAIFLTEDVDIAGALGRAAAIGGRIIAGGPAAIGALISGDAEALVFAYERDYEVALRSLIQLREQGWASGAVVLGFDHDAMHIRYGPVGLRSDALRDTVDRVAAALRDGQITVGG